MNMMRGLLSSANPLDDKKSQLVQKLSVKTKTEHMIKKETHLLKKKFIESKV